MAGNRKWLYKKGAVGSVLRVTLYGEDGLPMALTGWAVQLVVTAKGSAAKLIDRAMTNDPDQTANKGKTSYAIVTADDNALTGGQSYEMELTATSGSTVRKFPTVEDDEFASLVCLRSK